MIRERMKQILQQRGLSQEEAAEMLGISQGGLNHILNGKRKITSDFINLFSERMGISIESLLSRGKNTAQSTAREVPVIGFVQAGYWQEALEWTPEKIYYAYIPEFAEYRGRQICALEVRGDSMNKIYPEGTCVAYVSKFDYAAIHGDDIPSGKRVICQRNNPSDGTIEATVKEYIKNEYGTYLIPHSTNPAHQPYRIDDGSNGHVEIIGVVIWSGRRE